MRITDRTRNRVAVSGPITITSSMATLLMLFIILVGPSEAAEERQQDRHDEHPHATAASADRDTPEQADHDHAHGDEQASAATLPELPNNTCPVLADEAVDPAIHTTYRGQVVYFCCNRCRQKFLADPETYLANLPQFTSTNGAEGHDYDGPTGTENAAKHDHSGHEDTDSAWAKLGAFHPLAVHFPIALVMITLLAELLSILAGWEQADRAVRFLLVLSIPSALVAVALGLAAGTVATYPDSLTATFTWHRLAGITTGALVVFAGAAGLRWRGTEQRTLRKVYLGLLALAALAVTVTGHLGGSLVFGPGYLSHSTPASKSRCKSRRPAAPQP